MLYLYDGKGNVAALTDANQQVVAAYRYDGFGVLKAKSGTLVQPYQFSTKRYLAAIGVVKYEYRDYLAALGKWAERDPLGEEGGLNLYQLVNNNPINVIDPLGLEPPPFPGGPIYYANPFGGEPIEHNPFFTITDTNIRYAQQINDPWTFRGLVRNKAPWDYKQRGNEWEDFGNYNFGAAGAATGIFTQETLLREAGRAQCNAGTSNPKWGTPDTGPPFGDDPNDQYWIMQGWNDYMNGMYGKPIEPNPLWDIPWQFGGAVFSRFR